MKFIFNKPNAAASPATPEQHVLEEPMPSIFMDLPVEIQRHIITQFLSDPRTTFKEIKALRLVCRRFNAIVAPRVYSHIDVFSDEEDVVSNLRQLLTLLSSEPSEQLRATKTLTISDMNWVDKKSPFIPFSEVGLFCLLLNPVIAVSYYLIRPIVLPRTLPTAIRNRALCSYAGLKLYATPRFNLPNVTRIIWHLAVYDRKWIISRTAQVLRQLPQLEDLTLAMFENLEAFGHLVKCVSKLHNLRKLRFSFYYSRPGVGADYRSSRVNAIGKIIAANPNLKHLEVDQNWEASNLDFERMLKYVPADRPLKLEHIDLSHSCWNLAALIPHSRSLTSICIRDYRFLKYLLRNSIFPPTMEIKGIDHRAIEYLDRHPQIVSLTFFQYDDERGAIMEILSRHSTTLTHFGTTFWYFSHCINHTAEGEPALLKCTNLQQLVIYFPKVTDITPEMETVFSVISRLPNSLTLVIGETSAFEASSKYCAGSSNPLLRDLARRTVYKEGRIWYDPHWSL